MTTERSRGVVRLVCKECGESFSVTNDTIEGDVARGLSVPTRCPTCRKAHGRYLNSVGAGYYAVQPAESFDISRCHLTGLGRLDHPEQTVEKKDYSLAPPKEQVEKFSILEPAVAALIKNLEDPNGTKVSILVGPTGTGKSVWAPVQILRSKIGQEGRICVTQPRLVTLRAAKGKGDETTTPGYVAQMLGADGIGAGQEVGLLFSGESGKQDRYTRLLYVTDGVLIRWILSGQLSRFSVIIIDEAHEQSSNMELIFALLRYHLPLYPRLRLVIASATMDVERFAAFFGNGNPKSVFVAAPTQPATLRTIHDRWPDGPNAYAAIAGNIKLPATPDDVPAAVAATVRAIRCTPGFTTLGMPNGDIIAFVPTVRLVDRTIEAIRGLGLPNLEAYACHAQTESDELEAFSASERRAAEAQRRNAMTSPQRVIVATNYAETSVTLSNLRYVIDSGYILEKVWNPVTCSNEFEVRRHSRAGCTQRKGRVGRVLDGEVFRLYTQKDFDDPSLFPAAPRAAIARDSLEKFLLAAKAAGISDLTGFNWLGYDDSDELQVTERNRAMKALQQHGVVDRDGDVTTRGIELEGVRHASLDWSRVMSQSDQFGCALEVATFLSFTEQMQSPLLDNELGLLAYARYSDGCKDDLEFYLRIFHHWDAYDGPAGEAKAEWARAEGLNPKTLRQIEKTRDQGLEEFTERTHTDPAERKLDLDRLARVRVILAQSLVQWIYRRDAASANGETIFSPFSNQCPCKDPVVIERDSACAVAQDLQAFLCVGRRTVGRTIFAQHLVRVDLDWVKGARAMSLLGTAELGSSLASRPKGDFSSLLKQRITADITPPADLKQYQAGKRVEFSVLQYRKAARPGQRALVLARDVTTGRPLVIRHDGGALRPGSRFRTYVEGIDETGQALKASQARIFELYTRGQRVDLKALMRIRNLVARSDDGTEAPEPHGVLLELEPGVTALLSKPRDFDSYWKKFLEGNYSDGIITVADRQGIKLGLRFPDPKVGEVYEGFVSGFLEGRNGYAAAGVFVSIFPGVQGLMHYRSAGPYNIQSLSIGEAIQVQVLEITLEGQRQRIRLAGYEDGSW